MSDEITLTASLSGYKSSVMSAALARSVTGLLRSMAGNFAIEGVISVAITATLLPLGQVATPHWAFLYNADATNYVKVRNGASGADLIRLVAGDMAFVPLEPTSTPYLIADTAACVVEYLVFSL